MVLVVEVNDNAIGNYQGKGHQSIYLPLNTEFSSSTDNPVYYTSTSTPEPPRNQCSIAKSEKSLLLSVFCELRGRRNCVSVLMRL